MLTANEVLAVLGYSDSDPQSDSIPGALYALDVCTWGGADQGVYLTLQAITPRGELGTSECLAGAV